MHEGEDAALPEGVAPVHQLVGPALHALEVPLVKKYRQLGPDNQQNQSQDPLVN